MADDEKRDPDAWIERVVKIGGFVGMNPTRLRWKLMRWQENRRRDKRRLEQKIDHITYEHKTCPACGAVQDRDAATCSRCEEKLGARNVQLLQRIGLAMPKAVSVSTVLALALLAVYAREMIAMGGSLKTPSSQVLYDLGAHATAIDGEEPWRLLTAVLLHIGIWHIGFNVLALASIGPRIEELYGRGTMLFLFLATGAGANFCSDLAADVAAAGASGGIMGLVGVALGYGHRLGTGAGRALRDDMIKWTLYTLIFGYAVGADNWAHLFGGLLGAAFGLAVPARWWMRRRIGPVRVIAGLVGAALLAGGIAMIFTRELRPQGVEGQASREDDLLVQLALPCQLELGGRRDDLRAYLRVTTGSDAGATEDLRAMCVALVKSAEDCQRLKPAPGREATFCAKAVAVAATFPPLPR